MKINLNIMIAPSIFNLFILKYFKTFFKIYLSFLKYLKSYLLKNIFILFYFLKINTFSIYQFETLFSIEIVAL